jgi:hypothetical protein
MIKNPDSSHFLGCKDQNFYGSSFYALPPNWSPCMLSAALQGFLPSKLKPLGLSLAGQLRVAP